MKYLLSKKTADKIIPTLLQYMDRDPFSCNKDGGAYAVNSLYFDNACFSSFEEKVSGVSKRKKLRLRYYDDPHQTVFMEIKRKEGDVVIKDRTRFDGDTVKAAVSDGIKTDVISNDVTNEFLLTMHLRNMKPNVMVSYMRKAFVAKMDDTFRVTFDYDIRAWKADWFNKENGRRHSVTRDDLILELKFNDTLPHWFYEIIQKHRLHRIAYSKYCMSAEHLYPHLIA